MRTQTTDCGRPVKKNGSTDAGSSPDVEPAERPIIIDILGSVEDFQTASEDGIVLRMVGIDNDTDAPEPTSLTLNGRGIDLNDEWMVDVLNAAAGSLVVTAPDGPMPQTK